MATEEIVENRFKIIVVKENSEFARSEIFYNNARIVSIPYGRPGTFDDYLRALAGSQIKYFRGNIWTFTESLTAASTITAYSDTANKSIHIQYYEKLKKIMKHFNIKVSEYEIFIKTLNLGILLYKFDNANLNIRVRGSLFINDTINNATDNRISSTLIYIPSKPFKGIFEPYVAFKYVENGEYDVSIKVSPNNHIGLIRCISKSIKKEVMEELAEHTKNLFEFFETKPFTEEIIEF